MSTLTSDRSDGNIIPWPKERAAAALRAARADAIMGQLDHARGALVHRPIVLLAFAAAFGFILGRLVDR